MGGEGGGGGDGYKPTVQWLKKDMLPTGQKFGHINVEKSPQIWAAENTSVKFSSYIYNQKNFEKSRIFSLKSSVSTVFLQYFQQPVFFLISFKKT
jgi:hypothetical protein